MVQTTIFVDRRTNPNGKWRQAHQRHTARLGKPMMVPLCSAIPRTVRGVRGVHSRGRDVHEKRTNVPDSREN